MELKLSVLYIGNSSENLNLVEKHPDISLIQCSNALEAIRYLKSEQKPDIVISDYYLSGGSGLFIHEWLRERAEFDKVSFILLSYEFREEFIKTAFNRRMDDFFVLPLPAPEDLIQRMRFLVEFRNKYSISDYGKISKQDLKYEMPASKRVFDLLVAISALIVLSPLLLIVVLAIRL